MTVRTTGYRTERSSMFAPYGKVQKKFHKNDSCVKDSRMNRNPGTGMLNTKANMVLNGSIQDERLPAVLEFSTVSRSKSLIPFLRTM